MERRLAEKVIEAAMSSGEKLDKLALLAAEMTNETERNRFRKSIGEIMGSIYSDIMMPVIAQYPDLDPDRD